MRINVRFFAILKDRAGVEQVSLDLPDGTGVAGAAEQIAARFPDAARDLKRAAFAVNRNYVKPDAALNDGDELALIPPVSGGFR